MHAVEFETLLTGKKTLTVPTDVVKQLPASGRAKVIVLYGEEDSAWQRAAYEQFMREDAPEDAIYDKFAKNR